MLRRLARRPGDSERQARVRERLRDLAEESGLTFETGPSGGYLLVGAVNGQRLRVEPGTRGFPFDGDSVISATCPPTATVIAWPRDAPDEVAEGLGDEQLTHDEEFDARFSVFASYRDAHRPVLDETVRHGLFGLGIVALVVRDGEALLLLPGIPSIAGLKKAATLLCRIVDRSSSPATARG